MAPTLFIKALLAALPLASLSAAQTCFTILSSSSNNPSDGQYLTISLNGTSGNYTSSFGALPGTLFTLTSGHLSALNPLNSPPETLALFPAGFANAPLQWYPNLAPNLFHQIPKCMIANDTNALTFTAGAIKEFQICAGGIVWGVEAPLVGCQSVVWTVEGSGGPCPVVPPSPIEPPGGSFSATKTEGIVLPSGEVGPRPKHRIGGWELLGCVGSTSGFPTFSLVEENDAMTEELCVAACGAETYAGVSGQECYCANTLDAGTSTSAARATCMFACPGDPSETCGGLVIGYNGAMSKSKFKTKRQALISNDVLLTVYINVVPIPPAPVVYNAGDVIVNVDVVIYVDTCDTCPLGLTNIPYTSTCTTTACGCSSDALPTIPMTTVTKSCLCGPGGESNSVVLTVPCAAVTGVVEEGEIRGGQAIEEGSGGQAIEAGSGGQAIEGGSREQATGGMGGAGARQSGVVVAGAGMLEAGLGGTVVAGVLAFLGLLML